MIRQMTLAMLAALAVTFTAAPAVADGGDGKKLFKRKCAACHKMEKHAIGPMLTGVVGRKAGSTDFAKYKGLKGADFTWDAASLDGWLANPKKFIGKKTSMAGKIKKADDRAAIIRYLQSLTQ